MSLPPAPKGLDRRQPAPQYPVTIVSKKHGVLPVRGVSRTSSFTSPNDHGSSSYTGASKLLTLPIPILQSILGHSGGCSIYNAGTSCRRLHELSLRWWPVTRHSSILGGKDIKKTARRPLFVKIMILGSAGCGKSALVRTAMDDGNKMDSDSTTTSQMVEMKMATAKVYGHEVRFQTWDPPSSEKARPQVGQYCRKADGFIVAFDLTSSSSWSEVPRWLDLIRVVGVYGAPIVIVGTKADIVGNRPISSDNIFECVSSSRASAFVETSSYTRFNILEPFYLLASSLVGSLNVRYCGSPSIPYRDSKMTPPYKKKNDRDSNTFIQSESPNGYDSKFLLSNQQDSSYKLMPDSPAKKSITADLEVQVRPAEKPILVTSVLVDNTPSVATLETTKEAVVESIQQPIVVEAAAATKILADQRLLSEKSQLRLEAMKAEEIANAKFDMRSKEAERLAEVARKAADDAAIIAAEAAVARRLAEEESRRITNELEMERARQVEEQERMLERARQKEQEEEIKAAATTAAEAVKAALEAQAALQAAQTRRNADIAKSVSRPVSRYATLNESVEQSASIVKTEIPDSVSSSRNNRDPVTTTETQILHKFSNVAPPVQHKGDDGCGCCVIIQKKLKRRI